LHESNGLPRLLGVLVAGADIARVREVHSVQIHGVLLIGGELDTRANSEGTGEIDEQDIVELIVIQVGDGDIRNGRGDELVVVLLAPLFGILLNATVGYANSLAIIVDSDVTHLPDNSHVGGGSLRPVRHNEYHLLVFLYLLIVDVIIGILEGQAHSHLSVVLGKRGLARRVVNSNGTIDSSLFVFLHRNRRPANLRLSESDSILFSLEVLPGRAGRDQARKCSNFEHIFLNFIFIIYEVSAIKQTTAYRVDIY